jgi:hypothetical protein
MRGILQFGWATAVALVAVHVCPPAYASTLSFDLTKSYQSGNACTGCGPFGTVTVSSVTANEVQITLTLAPGNLFAFGGAGKPLVFDVFGNPTITNFQVTTTPANAPPNGFTFTQAPPVIMADGTGTWNDAVSCGTCAGGTGGNISGTLSFLLTTATPISPASFVQNGMGLYFASDIGVSSGPTGDVAALAPVPLPAAAWLLLSGLGGLSAFARVTSPGNRHRA